jgi:hypothetical protein
MKALRRDRVHLPDRTFPETIERISIKFLAGTA